MIRPAWWYDSAAEELLMATMTRDRASISDALFNDFVASLASHLRCSDEIGPRTFTQTAEAKRAVALTREHLSGLRELLGSAA